MKKLLLFVLFVGCTKEHCEEVSTTQDVCNPSGFCETVTHTRMVCG